jgi:hypothetical protein
VTEKLLVYFSVPKSFCHNAVIPAAADDGMAADA